MLKVASKFLEKSRSNDGSGTKKKVQAGGGGAWEKFECVVARRSPTQEINTGVSQVASFHDVDLFSKIPESDRGKRGK